MAKVFGIHTIELRSGVKDEEFEKYVLEEVAALTFEGCQIHLLKGDKGQRVGKYVLLFEIESVEARSRAFGAPGGPPVEYSEQVVKALEKRRALSMSSFTDYVVVGE